jgi:hypothetical protein
MIRGLVNLIKQKGLTNRFNQLNKFKMFSERFDSMIDRSLERKQGSQTQVITMDTVYKIFEKCKLYPKNEGQSIRLKYCPVCPKPHNEESTNLNTFVIYANLVYQCFRCGRRGKFQGLLKILRRQNDLKEYGNIISSEYSPSEAEDYSLRRRISGQDTDESIINGDDMFKRQIFTPIPTAKDADIDSKQYIIDNPNNKYKISISNIGLINEMSKRHDFLNNEKSEIIKEYLTNKRKLKMETLEFYRVGVSYEKFKDQSFNFYNLPTVSFPMFYPITQDSLIKVDKDKLDDKTYNHFRCDKFYLSKVKIRAIGKELKHFQRIEPTSALLWYMTK